MNKPLRIAFFLPDLGCGGVERMSLRLADEWVSRGIDVDFVVARAGGELVGEVSSRAKVVDLGAPSLKKSILPLRRYLREARPDALLASMWPLTFIAPVAAIGIHFGGTVIVREHAQLSLANARMSPAAFCAMRVSMAIGYRVADAVVTVSNEVATDVSRLGLFERSRIHVISNPAASGNMGESALPPPPPELQGHLGPVVLSIGTLSSVKRHAALIKAFARLDSDAKLCIVGEGPLRGSLESLISELGLTERVILPGFRADVSPWYSHADLFVLSSAHEGFGNVLVEALERGLPIVSTDCPGGPREILQDGRLGTLVPLHDDVALANAMQAALRSSHDPEPGRLRAQDFLVRASADAYLRLLEPHRSVASCL